MDFTINELVTVKSGQFPHIYKVVKLPNSNSARAFYRLEMEFVNIYGRYLSARNPANIQYVSKLKRKAIHAQLKAFDLTNYPSELTHF
jgi:hypothetical protein